MGKLYTFSLLVIGVFILLSFSTNPPDGNTGAPGDDLCTQCHIQTNPSQNGTISIEGFPSSITPHQTYLLTVINRLTEGNAVRAGFQVTILSPSNTQAGQMTNPSSSSAVSTFAGRQYWDHNPAVVYPDSNVVKWTVNWTAPDLPSGSQITWYAAGNIANGDFVNTGDRIVTASGSGTVILSSIDEPVTEELLVYPNPGSDVIHVKADQVSPGGGSVIYYDLLGRKAGEAEVLQGTIYTPPLPAGVYLLEVKVDGKTMFARWCKNE